MALVIGVGAGWLDRRGTSDAETLPASPPTSPTTSPPTVSTPTTTTTTLPVVIPEIGEVDPAIVALGRRVIDITGESDLATLLAALPAADGDPLAAAADRIRADFRDGDTIVVDGWILAASEARATAVIALLCDDTC